MHCCWLAAESLVLPANPRENLMGLVLTPLKCWGWVIEMRFLEETFKKIAASSLGTEKGLKMWKLPTVTSCSRRTKCETFTTVLQRYVWVTLAAVPYYWRLHRKSQGEIIIFCQCQEKWLGQKLCEKWSVQSRNAKASAQFAVFSFPVLKHSIIIAFVHTTPVKRWHCYALNLVVWQQSILPCQNGGGLCPSSCTCSGLPAFPPPNLEIMPNIVYKPNWLSFLGPFKNTGELLLMPLFILVPYPDCWKYVYSTV